MLHSVDIAVILAAGLAEAQGWTYSSLGERMSLSASQVHRAVVRCKAARLMSPSGREVNADPLLELFEHGFRWVFYPELKPVARGVPTAHSSPVMASHVDARGAGAMVWPSPLGDVRGQGVAPLYGGAPELVRLWPELYDILTLLDVLRLGRRREVSVALGLLHQKVRA